MSWFFFCFFYPITKNIQTSNDGFVSNRWELSENSSRLSDDSLATNGSLNEDPVMVGCCWGYDCPNPPWFKPTGGGGGGGKVSGGEPARRRGKLCDIWLYPFEPSFIFIIPWNNFLAFTAVPVAPIPLLLPLESVGLKVLPAIAFGSLPLEERNCLW